MSLKDRHIVAAAGTVISYCANDSFTGWEGAGKALLVGSGTGMGYSLASATIGLAALFLLGRSALRDDYTTVWAAAVLAGAVGGYLGYSYSKDWLTPDQNKTAAPVQTIVINPKLSWMPDTDIMTLKG